MFKIKQESNKVRIWKFLLFATLPGLVVASLAWSISNIHYDLDLGRIIVDETQRILHNLEVLGNVGIGTATPAHRLDVAGDINVPATGFLRIAGGAGADGQFLVRTATGMTWGAAPGVTWPLLATIDGTVTAPAYSWAADTDMGIRRGGVDDLRFVTAGVDRLTINALGNVGIGTTTPAVSLHIGPGTAIQAQSITQTTDVDFNAGIRVDTAVEGTGVPAYVRLWRGMTMVFVTTATTHGNIGGRAGADSFCSTNRPANLPAACGGIRAFLSVSATDEIRDMPTNYGFVSTDPIHWWNSATGASTLLATSWAVMLGGTISTSQTTGTGNTAFVWTGSTGAGALVEGFHCEGWTAGVWGPSGTPGNSTDTTAGWLQHGNATCSWMGALRCAAVCN